MTYVLAWRTKTGVYVVADSAVTSSPHGTHPSVDSTSFGEKNVTSDDRHVYEGAIKIVQFGSLAISFSGNAFYCRKVATMLKARLDRGAPPREAVQSVLLDWLDPTADVSVVVAFLEGGAPVLLAFNDDGRRHIEECSVDSMVQLGSAPAHLKDLSHSMFGLLTRTSTASDDHLAIALAWVQSYGLRAALMQSGVGGAFVGLRCDHTGFHWHRDALFAVADPRMGTFGLVESLVFQNAHIVQSTFIGGTSIFASDDHSSDDGPVWAVRTGGDRQLRAWVEIARSNARQGRYSYVALMSPASQTVVVLAMNCELEHAELTIVTNVIEDREEVHLRLHPALAEAIRRGAASNVVANVLWRPYRPPERKG